MLAGGQYEQQNKLIESLCPSPEYDYDQIQRVCVYDIITKNNILTDTGQTFV